MIKRTLLRFGAIGFALIIAQSVPLAMAQKSELRTRFVVVPFEETGSKDAHLPQATHDLMAALADRKVDAVLTDVQPHSSIAEHAQSICASQSADRILIGKYHADQTGKHHKGFLLGQLMAPPEIAAVMGVVNRISGLDKYAPTHSLVRLTVLDCSGAITRKIDADASGTARMNNADATVTSTIASALLSAVDKLRLTDNATGLNAVADPSPQPTNRK